jgi:hypothetical protein
VGVVQRWLLSGGCSNTTGRGESRLTVIGGFIPICTPIHNKAITLSIHTKTKNYIGPTSYWVTVYYLAIKVEVA